jgi:hypothetical protein
MKITHCKLNHLVNPLGYTLPQLSFSWQVEDATVQSRPPRGLSLPPIRS